MALMHAPDARPGPWGEIPALDLASLVRRHASAFGRVRACGDWSDKDFRRTAGPLLLAFARHAHLLPASFSAPCGSLLDAGLEACASALLAAPVDPAAQDGRPSRAAFTAVCQDAVVLHALSPWVVAATARWQVRTRDGRTLVLAARPLSDQLEDAPVPYLIESRAPCETPDDERPGLRPLGMVLLLRALAAPAMAAACEATPPLLEAALALAMPAAAALPPVRAPAPQDVIDAMRALITDGHWTLNVRRSRLWFLDGHLYLAWKTAANELSARLALDPALLLSLLVRHGIVIDRGPVMPLRTPYTEALPVVELADPHAWLRSVPPAGAGA
jgi:hypothetical protein